MTHVVDAAWKQKILDRTATPLKPSRQAPSRLSHDFKLNRSTGLLLDDGGARADAPATDDVANPNFDQVATAKLAVDREIEQSPISKSLMLVEVKSDGPDVPRFERALGANVLACIPRAPLMDGRVKV
jgi:hypothetical protein